MRQVAKGTVTITSPGATSDDTTPPVMWTFSGTQQSWRVLITNAKGQVMADSGQIVGTVQAWTPPKAVASEGATATVEVRVWDGVDRATTTSDPPYANSLLTFTIQGVGSVAPATSVQAVTDGFSPAVTVTSTRATQPDSWQVWRADGTGAPTLLSGATGLPHPLNYQDWTADMNKPHTYYAVPYINGTGRGQVGGVAPKVTVVPRCTGIWLLDPADPATRAVIWGDDAGDWDASELAVIHQPIAGPPIRRVAYRPPLSGSVTGELLDVLGTTADNQITALYDFKGDSRDLRLILGDRNLLVRIGDLLVAALPDSDLDRHSAVSFSWWQQGATPWSP
jgi:hypothetical protein